MRLYTGIDNVTHDKMVSSSHGLVSSLAKLVWQYTCTRLEIPRTELVLNTILFFQCRSNFVCIILSLLEMMRYLIIRVLFDFCSDQFNIC